MKLNFSSVLLLGITVLLSCEKEDVNQIPTANAGFPQVIKLPQDSVVLNGSGLDNDGAITTFLWREISGPNEVEIATSNLATTTVKGFIEGVYLFQLTVTDNDGLTGTDSTTVTVISADNKRPIAEAGSSQTIQLPKDYTTLTGNGYDEDGTIVAYLWSKISGPNTPEIQSPGLATTIVNNLTSGIYYFQLMVIDDDGATGVDTVSLTVLPPPYNTLIFQPGDDKGQDALVLTKEGDTSSPDRNFGQMEELNYSEWTYYGQGYGEGTVRSYIKFTELSSIPSKSTIISARLSLYGISSSSFTSQGNSPTGTDADNKGWIMRVASDWNESTITWNNKPETIEDNKVEIPGTTIQWNFNAVDLDVTNIVRIMVSENSNYGFCLALQKEIIYRNISFSSSEATDASLRPKLVITYQ